jgi:hypothetical protein
MQAMPDLASAAKKRRFNPSEVKSDMRAILREGETELVFSGKNLCATEFAKLMGPMLVCREWSVLSLKSNNLHTAGGKALAEGLKGNQVITELDISSNNLGLNSDYGADTSGIVALADAIPDMGALTSLNLADNSLGEMVEGLLPDGWKSKYNDDAAPWLRIEDGHVQVNPNRNA